MRHGAGTYDYPMRLLERSDTPNAFGESAQAWLDCGRLWCSMEALTASETVAGDHQTPTTTWLLRCHYRTGVTAAHRLALGSRSFEIRSVVPAPARDELEITVSEHPAVIP